MSKHTPATSIVGSEDFALLYALDERKELVMVGDSDVIVERRKYGETRFRGEKGSCLSQIVLV